MIKLFRQIVKYFLTEWIMAKTVPSILKSCFDGTDNVQTVPSNKKIIFAGTFKRKNS